MDSAKAIVRLGFPVDEAGANQVLDPVEGFEPAPKAVPPNPFGGGNPPDGTAEPEDEDEQPEPDEAAVARERQLSERLRQRRERKVA